MADKIPSCILRIDLDDATFEGTGEYVEDPTYINFFFGNNGSGKSTISKAIKSGKGVTYAPGTTADNYDVHLYDEAYIAANFESYHGMNGVYTINAINAEAQKKVDEQRALQAATRKKRTDELEAQDKKEKTRAELTKKYHTDCWDTAKTWRERFDGTQEKKRKSKAFTEAVEAAIPKDIDEAELQKLYDTAFTKVPTRYDPFVTIPDTGVLDNLSGHSLMGISIVNTANTEFAKFIGKIKATQWVREGHDKYGHNEDGNCPYCNRPLPENFEELFTASFDSAYDENMAALSAFLTEYRDQANTLVVAIRKKPDPVFPKIVVKAFDDKLAAVTGAISTNLENIRKKIEKPETIITLDPVKPLLDELAEIITGFNKAIAENNAIIEAGDRKKKECTEKVFSFLAFKLKDKIAAFKKSDAALASEIKQHVINAGHCDVQLRAIQQEITRLNSTTVETDSAMEHINKMLEDSRMQGFRLVPHEKEPHVYKVVRDDGTIADNLSEGEKNFLAFLYFYYEVQGSATPNGDDREKVIVIDDPVSSMDSNSLFIVCTLIRNMVEVCRNSANDRDPVAEGKYIKQIFILTHNAYFHRELTYTYVSKYEYVSFFLIRKRDNKSSVENMRDRNPKAPSKMMNINPVKSSYVALWEEYHEIQSPIPLLNVIRRILDYYFLQLCGYDSMEFRKAILVDARAEFKDENGKEDKEQYDLAQSMLSYINASKIGFNDGLHYVEEAADPKLCRNILEKIFAIMHQDQHYKMMTASFE